MAQAQTQATNKASNGVTLAGGAKAQPQVAAIPGGAKAQTQQVIVRANRFPDDARIVIKKEANPKREGSKAHKAFAFYYSVKAEADKDKKPLTVGAFKKALMEKGGQPLRYVTSTLDWDSKHGFIEVVPATASAK